jgi:hypothetical protein
VYENRTPRNNIFQNVRKWQIIIGTLRRITQMSKKLTPEQIVKVLKLLKRGLYQHEIAAIFDVNQGRISEIKNTYTLVRSKLGTETQFLLI